MFGVDRDIVLVRHGEYYKSLPPNGLTARGIEQAKAAGCYLNSLLARKRLSIHCIVHSGMQRAIETTREIVSMLDGQHPVSHSELLNEGSPSIHQVRNVQLLQ